MSRTIMNTCVLRHIKAQNKAHYEEKMQKVKAAQTKQRIQKEVVVPEVNNQAQVYKPITIFDKFWKLFNL